MSDGTPSSPRNFTRAELALYNGQNGQPAYVAVNGIVFDLTTVFIQGKHFMHLAGRDLTGSFLREHAPVVLSGYPVVGRLVE